MNENNINNSRNILNTILSNVVNRMQENIDASNSIPLPSEEGLRVERERALNRAIFNMIITNIEREYNLSLNSVSNVINNSFYDKPAYKRVISEEGLLLLKNVPFDETNKKNDKCPITMDSLEGKNVTVLPCDHCFDPSGILLWLNEKPECPICRYKLPDKEVKNEEDNDEEDNDEDDEEEDGTIEEHVPLLSENYLIQRRNLINILNNNIMNSNNIMNNNITNDEDDEDLQVALYNSMIN